MRSAHQHARKIAEAVNNAWHSAHGHGNIEAPVSVVAALSFITPPPGERSDIESRLLDLDIDDFTDLMRYQWRQFVHARPDLVNPAWPLINVWHGDYALDESAIKAAAPSQRNNNCCGKQGEPSPRRRRNLVTHHREAPPTREFDSTS